MESDDLSKYKRCEHDPSSPACSAWLDTLETTPELYCWSNLYTGCKLRRNLKKPKKPFMPRGEY